jgi:hypothetical protein
MFLTKGCAGDEERIFLLARKRQVIVHLAIAFAAEFCVSDRTACLLTLCLHPRQLIHIDQGHQRLLNLAFLKALLLLLLDETLSREARVDHPSIAELLRCRF